MNLTKIVSTDELRPAMNVAVLQNGYIYATNAHILIKIKVSDFFKVETDMKVLDLDLIKAISKAGKTGEVKFNEDCVQILNRNGTRFYPYSGTIETNGEMNMSKFSVSWDAHGCKYPDVESVLNLTQRDCLNKIGIDANLIGDLTRGFAKTEDSRVQLTFTDAKHYIKVEPRTNKGEQYGIIMPVTLED